MNNYGQSPISADLDGLTFHTSFASEPQLKQEYAMTNGFGFDPSMMEQNNYNRSSNLPNAMNWAGFNSNEMAHRNQLRKSISFSRASHSHMSPSQNGGLHSLNTAGLPPSASSHYGQVTPPRSNSATSEFSKHGIDSSGMPPEESTMKRRRGKALPKVPLTPPEPNMNSAKTKKAGGRKRMAASQSSAGNPEDDKRKASLEKNRVAAAKCRINKKEKTEQLQRDSHVKAKENVELRGLLETMETELQTLTSYLTAHANCSECRNPDQLQEALQMIQDQEMRKRFPGLSNGALTMHSPVLSISGESMGSGLYSESAFGDTPSNMNPPLPEFNLAGDLDMSSMNSPLPL